MIPLPLVFIVLIVCFFIFIINGIGLLVGDSDLKNLQWVATVLILGSCAVLWDASHYKTEWSKPVEAKVELFDNQAYAEFEGEKINLSENYKVNFTEGEKVRFSKSSPVSGPYTTWTSTTKILREGETKGIWPRSN